MVRTYVLGVLAIAGCCVLYWYKANSREVYGFEWGPFKWWLYTGLISNYLGLWAWWRIVEVSDVWKAGVVWLVTSLCVDLTLNTLYFGYNPKGVIALSLCALAAYVVHH